MSFEVETVIRVGSRVRLREVDIRVLTGGRMIDCEVKTYLGGLWFPRGVRGQFAKDILGHLDDGWANLRYLYNPQVAAELGKVRAELWQAFRSPTVQRELRRRIPDAAARKQLTTQFRARLEGDLVGIFPYAPVP